MTPDEQVRAAQRRAEADPGDRAAVDALVVALRRAGREREAWDALVADVEARCARAAADPMRETQGREPWALLERESNELREIDGREPNWWARGNRVQIVSPAAGGADHRALPPKPRGLPTMSWEGMESGRHGHLPRPVPLGTEGVLFWIPKLPGIHHEPVNVGVRLDDEWVVFCPIECLARVVAPNWPELDRRRAERELRAKGAFPPKGARVEGDRVDPKDGLRERVKGEVCWAGVTRDGVARVGIKRRGKDTAWVDASTVKVTGAPKRRCMLVRLDDLPQERAP